MNETERNTEFQSSPEARLSRILIGTINKYNSLHVQNPILGSRYNFDASKVANIINKKIQLLSELPNNVASTIDKLEDITLKEHMIKCVNYFAKNAENIVNQKDKHTIEDLEQFIPLLQR